MEPTTALTAAIDNASKVANTPLFTTIIDKLTGFKISEWSAQGEVRKRMINDEYEKAKQNGVMGMEYIRNLRQTSNLIETAVKSSEYIDPKKQNDIKFDNDFFWNTIEHAKTISNEKVQELIAKIIAGEYNKPGSYSMSTLQCLKLLGKKELETFQKITTLCVNGFQIPQSVFSGGKEIAPIMQDLQIDFGTLQNFQNLGLFLPNSMSNTIDNFERKNFALQYFEKAIIFVPNTDGDVTIKLPSYFGLSNSGNQIVNHLSPKYNEQYYQWLKSNFKINNYKLKDE